MTSSSASWVKVSWVVAMALFFAAGTAMGQGDLTGVVVVNVIDESGGVLPGVRLQLQSAARSFDAITNERGQFRFLVVPAGSYSLEATLHGFSPARLVGIEVSFGSTYNASITMSVGALTEEITVLAARPQVDVTQSASSELLDQGFIQDIPLRERNFQDLVNLLPGVVDGQVRGSRDTSTGFRIDGASNVDPYNSGVAIVFSQQAIDRLEMVPSGFEARYGEFSGGVVNVTTRSGTNIFQAHLGYYFRNESLIAAPPDSYPGQEHRKAKDSRKFVEAAIGGPIVNDRLHYFTTLEYRYSDVGNVFAARTSETDSYLGSVKLSYTPRAEDQWTLFVAGNIGDTKNTVATRFIAPEFNANTSDDRYLLSAQQSHIFSENLFLESQLSYLGASRSQRRTDPDAHVTLYRFTPQGTFTSGRFTSDSDRSLDRVRLNETLSWYAGPHQFGFGIDAGYLSTKLDQTIGPTRFDFRELGNPLALHYYFDPVRYDQSGFEGALYAQDKWLVTRRLTVSLGARLEYQELTEESDLAPRLGIVWDPVGDSRTKVYGNWGKYVERIYDRYLEWGSQPGGRYFFVFNPEGPLADGTPIPGGSFGYRVEGDNRTPFSNAWTVGVEHLFGEDFRLGLAYTDKDLKNQLLTYYISDYPEDWYEFRANGVGRYKGLDLVASKRFSKNWGGRASYTWSEQTGMGGFLGTFYGPTQIPPVNSIEDSDRTHVTKVSGYRQLPWGVLVSGSYLYATGLPYSVITYDQSGNPLFLGERNSKRMPSIQSLDLAVQKAIQVGGARVVLVAEAFNLTNHKNVLSVTTAEGNHGDPTAFDVTRTFQLGFRVAF